MELLVVRIDDRNDLVTLHQHIGPVVRRVVVGDGIGETGVGISHISSLGTTEKTLCELCGIDIRRDYTIRHSGEGSADDISVSLHLVIGDTVRILVDFFEIRCAGNSAESSCRKRKYFVYILVHYLKPLLEFDSDVEAEVSGAWHHEIVET